MKRIYLIAIVSALFLSSCNSEPTLQKYFVEKSEKKNFTVLDLAPSLLKINKAKLTAEELKALDSFDKINILAFTPDSLSNGAYNTESQKVKTLLQNEKYQLLMKFGSGKDGASVSFVGDDEHIDEFVLYAAKKENGFAVVRIIGKDMNPNGIMSLMSIIKNSDLDVKQLEPLKKLMK